MSRIQRDLVLIRAGIDERLAVVATAVDADSAAGRALAEVRAALDPLGRILDDLARLAQHTLDIVAVLEEHEGEAA